MQQNPSNNQLPRCGIAFLLTLLTLEITVFLSNDMYIPALSAIGQTFNMDKVQVGQTISIWFLGSTIFQLLVGPLADRYGYKQTLALSCLNFAISSIICATTSSPSLFFICRFLEGASVGFIATAGHSIIHETQTSIKAVKTTSTMRSISIVAPALGPYLGAIFVKHYNWRLMFVGFGVSGLMGWALFLKNTPLVPPKIHRLELKKILNSYLGMIFREKKFILYGLCASFNFMFLISWIIESVNVVINIRNKSEYVYGAVQISISFALSIGGHFSGKFARLKNLKKAISILYAAQTSLLALAYILQARQQNELFITSSIVGLGFLVSGVTSGVINRLAIESSKATVNMSNAMISTMRSLAGSLAAFITALTVGQSVKNLMMLLTIYFALSLLSFSLIKNIQWKESES